MRQVFSVKKASEAVVRRCSVKRCSKKFAKIEKTLAVKKGHLIF